MYSARSLEDEIWELREHTAHLQVELIRAQRRLRELERQLTLSSPEAFRAATSQQHEITATQNYVEAPAAVQTEIKAAPQRSNEVPEMDIKSLTMEERMGVIREYADRYSERFSQKVIAAALHISTSTYTNMLAGRGIYAKYVTGEQESDS